MQRKGPSISNFNSRKSRQGFMLVDGLIAVLIVAIGLASLAFMYTHGIKTRVGGERRQAAVQLAGQEMERLKKFDGGTLKQLQDNVRNEQGKHLKKNSVGPTDYEIKSEIVESEEFEPSASESTHKIETVMVTVSWDDSQENELELKGYILVTK